MKATLVPRKLRAVRDKGINHRRTKSNDTSGKPRTSAEIWHSIFRPDTTKQAQKDKGESEKEATKISAISTRILELNHPNIAEDHIRSALQSKYAAGDPEKALELLQLQHQASSGKIQPYNPNTQMLGAENLDNVTCYLDSLLFAMFAKLTAFECMLKNDSASEADRKLTSLLRLWVNMLRSGKLIHTDMAEQIQEALAECGWPEAKELEQQDTSEAFGFITEKLQLPLLTLQVDLFHQGKGDADDHKVVHERLLNLAVPPDPDGKGIKLEDCLEEYFNNKVDVLRDSHEEKGLESSLSHSTTTIRLVTPDEEQGNPNERNHRSPLLRRWTTNPRVHSTVSHSGASVVSDVEARPVSRNRSTSIIQRIVVDDEGHASSADGPGVHGLRSLAKRGSTVVKAVTIPAWQFFRLIPWHAASSPEPINDDEVARHFNQRPVVGICLKRYTMTETGIPIRQNTMIDIPDSLRLPHFMLVGAGGERGQESEHRGLSQEYKLVLQSVVCHRGESVHSGHYVSFARVAPKLLTDNRRHDDDPPPDYEEALWVKFDDLATENRVSNVDDIKQALREEMPYLLFYQIVPMIDEATASTNGSITEPPSYDDLDTNTSIQSPLLDSMQNAPGSITRSESGYFDKPATLLQPTARSTNSSEMERSGRLSLDDSAYAAQYKTPSRRASLACSESTGATPIITPDTAPSPAGQDESTASRLSRAAARFKAGTKSRPTSQGGEGRISFTMSRLGLVRNSKEPLRETFSAADTETSDDPGAIAEEGEAAQEREETKDIVFLALLGAQPLRRDRGKSKNRDKEESRKEKGKASNGTKEVKPASSVPDRECAVM